MMSKPIAFQGDTITDYSVKVKGLHYVYSFCVDLFLKV